jgi:hypothetical protein
MVFSVGALLPVGPRRNLLTYRRRDALGARAATTFNSVIVVWYLRPGAFSAASLAKSSPDHRHVTVLPARSN